MYVVDTDILVDLYRGHGRSVEGVAALESEAPLAITSVTVQEMSQGAYGRPDHGGQVNRLRRLLTPFEILDFDGSAGWIAGRLMAELSAKGRPIGELDTMIAATVIAHNGILITRNHKHFDRIRGLDVQSL